MKHRLFRFHVFMFNWRYLFSEELLALLLVIFVFVSPVAAATRLQNRELMMNDATPSAVTSYTVSFEYISPQAVGSVDMLFCNDPIPYDPCVPPTGLDVSHAVLSSQSGEQGFRISKQTSNHILLSRPAVVPTTNGLSSYTFSNITNPQLTNSAFSIRLQTHTAQDASDAQIDFGSVRGEVNNPIVIQTQVPPMLIFCAAQVVQDNCTSTNDTYYSNLGTLSPTDTLKTYSQMAVGTNASGGFAITAVGTPMAAGTTVIDPLAVPTQSIPGTNQFGINLVANTDPTIGYNPQGTWNNALPASLYAQPNKYMFQSGDVVATSSAVSLMEKFTVSYIVNSSKDLRAGVYTTTITYIASGRF